MLIEYCHIHGGVTPITDTLNDVTRCPVCDHATSTTMEEAIRYFRQDQMNVNNYTDYNYNVQIRIDSDSGALTVFCFGQDSGEIGSPIHGGRDIDIANSLGRSLVEDARREEHGWEPGETLEEHQ